MTNERDTQQMDELVSKTYRELADEQTPDHLSDSVLRMAAIRRTASRRYWAFGAWTKPVAWAATVGLSLAIVLEVTQFTDTQTVDTSVSDLSGERSSASSTTPASVVEAAPAPASVRDRFVPRGENVLEEAERIAELSSGPDQSNYGAVATPPPQKTESPTDESTRSDLRKAAEITARPALEAKTDVPAIRSPAVSPPTSSALERRSSQMPENSAAVPQLSQIQASRLQKNSDPIGICLDDDRETAQAWFACIEALRKSGNSEDADRENKAFQLQHPDFLPHE